MDKQRVTEEQETRAKLLIGKHLVLNAQTLAALRRAGLKADAIVQLDFMFVAPDKSSAESLKSYLEENDCVALQVEKQPELHSKAFLVMGKSHPTTLTSDLLDTWVPWMVVQGILQNCEFDGWGTEVPTMET